MKDVVVDEIMKALFISNEDFEKYFNKEEWITREDYKEYLQLKLDNS